MLRVLCIHVVRITSQSYVRKVLVRYKRRWVEKKPRSPAMRDTTSIRLRRAYELRSEGLSMQAIAGTLNAEGYTMKAGRRFRKMQVKRVLDREALYRGQYRYAGIERQGRHEAIL